MEDGLLVCGGDGGGDETDEDRNLAEQRVLEIRAKEGEVGRQVERKRKGSTGGK